MKKFEVKLLEEAREFLQALDKDLIVKIIKTFAKASILNDPKIFKKLEGEIWEFRIKHSNGQYRILAFWDKRNKLETLVVATHGFVKKTSKVPKKEIKKAEAIRERYMSE